MHDAQVVFSLHASVVEVVLVHALVDHAQVLPPHDPAVGPDEVPV